MASENRLIYADALRQHWLENGENEHIYDTNAFLDSIDDQPTVDAIVTPVKVGQVLWCNVPHSEFPLECRVYCICREERNGLVLDYFRCAVKGWFAKAFSFEDVGKTIFLTEAEALAKMDGERKDNE